MVASSGSSRGRSWPDLPSELLGLVVSRLPSHADRVRFGAVCLSWRSSAQLQQRLPSLLPLLGLPDGTFLSLPDGAVHRMPVASDVSRRVSTGGALFLLHRDDTCSLMDPSAGTTIPVPPLAIWFRINPVVHKVVVSDHLIAALVTLKPSKNSISLRVDNSLTKVIVSTRALHGSSSRFLRTEWDTPEDSYIRDIALFQGKLYVLTTEVGQGQREIHMVNLGGDQRSKKAIRRVPNPAASFDPYATDNYVQRNYLVVSGDRLLMVERRIYLPPLFPVDSGSLKRTHLFKVFEAADLSSGCGRWIEVDRLAGRALFVTDGCSESLPVMDQCGGIEVQEDCIYFINDDNKYAHREKIHENPLLDSGVYNLRDRTIMPLPSEMAVTPSDGPWPPTWLFPKT